MAPVRRPPAAGARRPSSAADLRPSGSSTQRRPARAAERRGTADERSEAPDGSLTAEALSEVLRLELPADVALRGFMRRHPVLGRRDRAEIAETVFDVLRNRRRYAHLAQAGQGLFERRLALISLAVRQAWPTPGSRGPLPRPDPAEQLWLERCASVDRALLKALRTRPVDPTVDSKPQARATDPIAALALATSLPDWAATRLVNRLGIDDAAALAQAMLKPARLQLRVNPLRGVAEAALAALAADGIVARPFSGVPGALEIDGHPALEKSACFTEGQVEVQDVGSQLLAMLVGARRGQTVIDLCAGAGGKTLALAAAMRSLGQIFACDVSPERLRRMRPRLQRSGATNVQPFAIDSLSDRKLVRLAGRADAVLVDAPCTGSGTWRRNPDLKWRIGPTELERLIGEQRAILRVAAGLLKPGGVLVYGTCSLLTEENESQAAWFEETFPAFRREPVGPILEAQGVSSAADLCRDGFMSLRPDRHGTDAFFGVRWRAPS